MRGSNKIPSKYGLSWSVEQFPLGNTPKTALTGLSKLGITKVRGDWLRWRDIPLMPTFHPAYLLRNPAAVKLFEDDLRKVLERLRVICE